MGTLAWRTERHEGRQGALVSVLHSISVQTNRSPPRCAGNTPDEFLTGFIRCEQEWLRRFAQPRLSTDPFYGSAENNDPNNHIHLLDYCLEAFRNCTPSSDLCSPVIWHPDLHRSNIFVTDHTPYTLIGVIDWQYSGISPFFTRTMLPNAFAYEGGRVQFIPDSARQPLPSNFEELSEVEKKLTLDDQFDAGMRTLYEHIMMKKNAFQHIFHTSRDARVLMRPFHAYPATWAHGLGKMQYVLAHLQHEWEEIAPSGSECPFHFSEEDFKRIIINTDRISLYDEKVAEVRSMLNLQADGWITNELYDVAATKNKELQEKWNDEENGGPYPYQDGASSIQT